ncbi:MAG: SDR family NAD(P)-dependent oxidoreductase [Cucumibacter sp.]
MSKGQVAWVVGASSGIGAAVARRLAAEGFSVAISARRAERLAAMAAEIPGLHPFPLDAGDREAAAETCRRIISELGGLDLAVFSAAEWHQNTIADYDAARYAAVTRVDYLGAVNMIDPAVTHMKQVGGGQIAIVSSIAGYYGFPSGGPYGPSKAALIQLAQMMRTELAPLRIDVRLVSPGFVDTELTQRNAYPMPFTLPAEEAGRRIVDGLLRSKRFEIAFPWPMVLAAKIGRMLPYPLFFLAMKRMLKTVTRKKG